MRSPLGGVGAAVAALANYAAESGRVRASIASFHSGDEEPQKESLDSLATEISWHGALPGRVFRAAAALRDMAEAHDIIHLHGLWQPHTALGARISRRLQKPYLVSAHGMLDRWAINHKGWKKQPYAWLIERPNLRGAACLRALTLAEVKDYRSFGLQVPIAVVPNGVLPPVESSPDLFYSKWPNLKGKRIALFLGRLHAKKGLIPLCKAWSQVANRLDDVHLVLAGPDQNGTQAHLQRLIDSPRVRDSVSFTGLLGNEMKWSALAASTVFVLPSFSEGFSVAILEALSAARPVIITEQCNFLELARKEFAAVTQPQPDPLQAALIHLLTAPGLRLERLGSDARRYVEEHYSWPRIGNAMADVYEWLLGGPRPSHVDFV